jgi:hypothetical protein
VVQAGGRLGQQRAGLFATQLEPTLIQARQALEQGGQPGRILAVGAGRPAPPPA